MPSVVEGTSPPLSATRRPPELLQNEYIATPPTGHDCRQAGRRCKGTGRTALVALAIGASALLLYVPRAFRTLSLMGDSAELVTASVVWGVPHAPGYPLYIAITHALTLLPFGDLPFRVHLTSALFHAATASCIVLVVSELTRSELAAAGAGLLLVLSRSFFVASLYAEVFPLNDLFFGISLILAIRIARSAKPHARIVVFMALLGTACTHHFMFFLAIPTIAILVVPPMWACLREPRRSRSPILEHPPPGSGWRLALWTVVSALPFALSCPLLFYAASREPAVSWGDIHDWHSLLRVATRQDYGGLLSASAHVVPNQLLERLDLYFEILGRSFGLGIVFALVGVVTAFRPRRSLHRSILFGFALSGPGFATLNAFDIHSEHRAAYFERFVTMSHVALAVLIGTGIAALESAGIRRHLVGQVDALDAAGSTVQRTPRGRGWIARIAVAATLAPLLLQARKIDFHADHLAAEYARDLIRATPDHSLILLAGDMPAHAALYACTVEKLCGTRIVLSPGQLLMRWKADQVARRYPMSPIRPSAGGIALEDQLLDALRAQPVYVHPELLRKHTRLHDRFVLVPELLLLRAYESDRSVEEDRDLRGRYDNVARGITCSGCGHAAAPPFRPSMQVQLLSAYATGLDLQAVSANALGWKEDADWLERQARTFREAAR